MTKYARLSKSWFNFLFDHPILKTCLEYSLGILVAALSAVFFAFGYTVFVVGYNEGITFVTGGVSGISQNIIAIMEAFGLKGIDPSYLQSIFYFAINIPLIIFSFLKIGRRFSIFTLINVGLTSLCISLFTVNADSFVNKLASNSLLANSVATRAMFAGVSIGLSSSLAFKGYFSAGGMDIVSYYVSLKKSTGVGKYTMVINATIVITYFFIHLISNSSNWNESLISLFYSLVYLVVLTIVVDLVNTRNKKVQVQVITHESRLSDILISNFPHGVTILKGIGGYSKKDRYIVWMAISSSEIKKVIRVIKACDAKAFVEVTALQQVYGNFFIKPIK